ncbi:hypothetical protein AACH06_14100 [Ideonella sp. DXS29W]|uniref:Protease n=1 Tax=Ideonella lacteola TaxID=2984193 RepID=A0ABU9BQ09_9BURK
MTMKQAAITFIGAMAASSSIAASGPPAPTPAAALRCTLEAPARAVAGQAVMLRFSFSNEGAAALRVLRWNTPLEGAWFAPFVEVRRDGRKLPFQGPMIKRAEPRAEDYVAFAPGQTITAEVDLALPFDLSAPGHYRIEPRLRLFDVRVDSGHATAPPRAEHHGSDLPCPSVEIELTAR